MSTKKGKRMENERRVYGSGKQVLMRILAELSTKKIPKKDLDKATEWLQTGLLLHGSTAYETCEHVSRMVWASSKHEADKHSGGGGQIWRQGIATRNGTVFISDMFETIRDLPNLREEVLKSYPDLVPEDYEAAMHTMWLVISSAQMFTELLCVEIANADIDIDRWVKGMMRYYKGTLKAMVKDGWFEKPPSTVS